MEHDWNFAGDNAKEHQDEARALVHNLCDTGRLSAGLLAKWFDYNPSALHGVLSMEFVFKRSDEEWLAIQSAAEDAIRLSTGGEWWPYADDRQFLSRRQQLAIAKRNREEAMPWTRVGDEGEGADE